MKLSKRCPSLTAANAPITKTAAHRYASDHKSSRFCPFPMIQAILLPKEIINLIPLDCHFTSLYNCPRTS